MANLRRVVLDVLKPHLPNVIELSSQLADLAGVDGVDISLIEMDQKVENVKITCEGDSIDYEKVEQIIKESGGSIHSLDKVSVGTSMIEEAITHQD
ncbi:hypothetical protein ES705_00396 [subsurface metagenome]|uniref:DUF211 domain-containing protein n=1 Tax=marine sediment metagenome TaxID=412755 RepID=X1GSS7_9ZZZZ|nr:hypothetical protein [Clostridia bacterium]